jgi:hypothetical protein
MSFLPKSVSRLRQEAKALSKKEAIPHTTALEFIARSYGFPNWKAVLNASDKSCIAEQSTPLVFNDYPQDSDAVEQSTDFSDDVEVRVSKNKAYFVSLGIEFSMFEPTITGLKKSIIDATSSVRSHFELEKFHFFDQQGQGGNHKVTKCAYFVTIDAITSSKVSLYRPKTKQGDPRMWFSKLQSFAQPTEKIAIVVFDDGLYLFNFSCICLENLTSESEAAKFIAHYVNSKNSIAEELLKKLKKIAKSPIKSIIKGDTAVGMAVEFALNIVANSSKQPDYKGIELKAGRGEKNRASLFAQVADWSISPCKSSADILDKYGYQREDDFKLYCTVSAQKVNSQGLRFFYDESADQLIEKDRDNNNVAIWQGTLLRKRLLEKHTETFWINATSIMINGVEHFKLISVTHTKRPLESQLLPLIQSGMITMDHLIKRKGGSKPSVSEKGPLFKIDKRNLAFLFPEPKVYFL